MADNPNVIEIPEWQWVKVATKVKYLQFTRLTTNVSYYKTYRLTGDEAPENPTNNVMSDESVKLFELSKTEEIKSDNDIDLYIICANHDDDNSDIGKVIIETTNNSRDVYVQDPTTASGDLHLLHELNSATLALQAVAGESSITLEAGHGFVAGDYITIEYESIYYQSRVYNVATNVIYLSVPLFYAFPVESTIYRKSAKIEVYNGSTTPVVFEIAPPVGVKWHIYGFTFVARDATAMSDEKFVGATALTKGILLSKNNGVLETRFNVRDNSGMKLVGVVDYSDYSPSEEYGLKFYKDLRNSNGIAMVLDGNIGEKAQFIVQDDLTVLTYGRAMLHGHIVE